MTPMKMNKIKWLKVLTYYIYYNKMGYSDQVLKSNTSWTYQEYNDNKPTYKNKIILKVYLDSQYEQKEFIKKLGGKWDPNRDQWYLLNPSDETIKKITDYSRIIKGKRTGIEIDEQIVIKEKIKEDKCLFIDSDNE